ncbi:hypothetical protein E3P92_00535 [Wallemia ichthyophaga]|uniref:Uncharacterized protein n=1 Tax=Wallemia ichthyophaga TaxID=245174 RepID=A0A4T0L611_WALIC|nr:hypothetical protein E3P97_00275 [Wallemia ichthyophaga]TIB02987.1 hypothetical protein E3P96_01990 [Wallemia ichthyophaga]TIB08734.1 hypothetical protein E3P90_03553 [Wallemia ichthyophaga]TIB10220.1 hypothetical protein E3P93_02966 [Wallemia ichthyophaga]TIB18698.1 hypothetical protein E3P92_00535 [Wallemia ichthyophaga]
MKEVVKESNSDTQIKLYILHRTVASPSKPPPASCFAPIQQLPLLGIGGGLRCHSPLPKLEIMPATIQVIFEHIKGVIASTNGTLYQTCRHLYEAGLPLAYGIIYGTKVALEDASEEKYTEHLRFLSFIADMRHSPVSQAVREVFVNLETPEFPNLDLEMCKYLHRLVNL